MSVGCTSSEARFAYLASRTHNTAAHGDRRAYNAKTGSPVIRRVNRACLTLTEYSQWGGRVKDDVHGLRDADAVDVLDHAQRHQRRATTIIDQERHTAAMQHPRAVEHT